MPLASHPMERSPLLHPRLLKQYAILIILGFVPCGYVAGITITIIKLAQGASLRLITLCILLMPAILVLESILWFTLVMPERVEQLPWLTALKRVGHGMKKTALLLYMRMKYGKQQPGIYAPIDSSNQQIRLLVIDAGQPQDEIRCSLLPIYLQNNHPEYEALSYTWGPSHSPHHIVLNGSPFATTLNLYGALKQLRKNDVSRALWVDALSIDQSNILERGEQILLMKLIYSHASKVIVWLGEETLSDRHAMDLLCSGNEQMDPQSWFFDNLQSAFQSEMTQWRALLSLFQRDYWSRVWIIQETAVATNLDIVCGSRSCKWEVAVAAQQVWIDFRSATASKKQQEIIDTMESFTPGERTGVSLTLIPRNKGPLPLSINRSNISLLRTSTLVSLLQESWTALATDPRDKIFALLGLATDCQTPTLSADYSLSKWETYLRTMNFLLENFGNLDLVAYSGIHLIPSFYRAPSWMPTFYWAWEAPSTATYSQYLYKTRPNIGGASGSSKAVATFLPQRKPFDGILGIHRAILKAQSCRIGIISRCLYEPSKHGMLILHSELNALRKKLQIASTWLPADLGLGLAASADRELIDDIRILYHYFVLDGELSLQDQSAEGTLQKERKTETLWRTLVLNRNIDGTIAPDTWASMFAVILEGPSFVPEEFDTGHIGQSANDRALTYIQPYLYAARQLRAGKRWLFETTGGKLGIANYGAMAGDDVCVILGCYMPMVMRQRKIRKGNEFIPACHGRATCT